MEGGEEPRVQLQPLTQPEFALLSYVLLGSLKQGEYRPANAIKGCQGHKAYGAIIPDESYAPAHSHHNELINLAESESLNTKVLDR